MKKFAKILLALNLSFFLMTCPGCTQNQRTETDKNRIALDKEILKELNFARQHPKKYATFLEQERPYYVGKFIKRPGEITIISKEGVSAVDEAIRFLKKINPVAPLNHSTGMSRAAMDHVRDQGKRGAFGHKGSDGSQPADRVSRYGKWLETVGENIAYGRDAARDIVIGLIVDDGVPNRGHRDNIFNPQFRIVGIACGAHKTFGTMCVMNFA
ncbi:CAP domain-containing protein, partial [candidate division KSB1 bacterium]|nr:CAP domain-containing protein [candidate division KSB1 bacterium]